MKKIHFLNYIVSFLLLISCSPTLKKEFTIADISIIPKPSEMVLSKGSFTFNKNTKIVLNSASQKSIASEFIQQFKISTGIQLQIVDKNASF